MLQSHSAKLFSGTNAAPAYVLNNPCPPTASIKLKPRTDRYSAACYGQTPTNCRCVLRPNGDFPGNTGVPRLTAEAVLVFKVYVMLKTAMLKSSRGRGKRTTEENTGKLSIFSCTKCKLLLFSHR